mgnify:CR=1 FL=1
MFLHVLEARHVGDPRIWLRCNDGSAGTVDLASELTGPVFESLLDLERFSSLRVAHHTVCWDNGADFAPEFLRQRLVLAA